MIIHYLPTYPVPSSEKGWVAANFEVHRQSSDCGSELVVQLRGYGDQSSL